MKMGIFHICILVLFLLSYSTVKGDSCGGLLMSLGGKLDVPANSILNQELQCVWIIQLMLEQTIEFNLKRLDGQSSSVTLYPEHFANETVIGFTRMTTSDVDKTVYFPGQTLVVVFTRSDFLSGISFTWNSLSSESAQVFREANYMDSGIGNVEWSRLTSRERLTSVFNIQSTQSLVMDLEMRTEFEQCSKGNPCDCSYFSLYEILSNGYLMNVHRVCGTTLTLQAKDLATKLLAFVYINSESSSSNPNLVEISWESHHSGLDLACGGLINLPAAGDFVDVRYKSLQHYENNEHCVWSLKDVDFPGIQRAYHLNVTLLTHGFQNSGDGLALYWRHGSTLASSVLDNLIPAQVAFPDRSFISFTSDNSLPGTGFVVRIHVVSYTGIPYVGQVSHLSNVPGSYVYGPGSQNLLVSLVVNPLQAHGSKFTTFGVDHLNIAESKNCEGDHLQVFEISQLGLSMLKANLCGKLDFPLKFSTEFPVLFLLYDELERPDSSFSISWNATQSM